MDQFLEIEDFTLYPHEKTLFQPDNIPLGSGIYAWYLDFSKFKNFNTVSEFSKKLEMIDSLITLDELNGTVKSYFKNYNVSLNENRPFLEKYYMDDSEEEINWGDKIRNFSIEDCKKIMDLFSNFSILVNPLYVGISNSLQTRWKQHRDAFQKIKRMQEDREDEELLNATAVKSFGGRVALKGFNWEYLIFACVEKNIERNLIGETEYLINRFYNPLFGRR